MIRYRTIKKGSSLIITVALWKYTVDAILLISLVEESLLLLFEGRLVQICLQVRIRNMRIVVDNLASTCFKSSSRLYYIEVPLLNGKIIRNPKPILMHIEVSTIIPRHQHHFYSHADGKQHSQHAYILHSIVLHHLMIIINLIIV